MANAQTKQLRYNDRNPGKATFSGDAGKKIGRNCLLNKLHIFNEINLNWIEDISDDILRQRLQKQFIIY